MINLKTKDAGMIYTYGDMEYTIYHGYFRVVEFQDVPSENKVKIHIMNNAYDTVITPFKDNRETLTVGCIIKVAYVTVKQGITCHGYEVTDEERPELEWDKLPTPRRMLSNDIIDVLPYKKLLDFFIDKISDESIRLFIRNILEKEADKFYTWPAATTVHHNYQSGLLQHTVNVVKNAYTLASNYNNIDMDIVLSGAILHDIGKVYEYNKDGTISGEGNMFDHLNIGTRIIFNEYYHGKDKPYAFSERDLYHIAHIILSHHGKLEWGSSKTPATQEALLVHYADYIDTNMFITFKELLPLDVGQTSKSFFANTTLVQTKFQFKLDYDKKINS